MGLVFVFFLLVEHIVFSKIRDAYLLHRVTNLKRGTKTERKLVLELLKSGIPFQTVFHDLYVVNQSGKYSQIDLVVATKVGIIVVEVKEYSGWIFGTGYQPNWTQVLAYGKQKYRLYNPIFQNNKHIEDLKKQSKQFENIPFYSIIVFYGNCVLKDLTFIPDGTFIVKSFRVLEVIRKIINENEPAKYTNKREVVNILNSAVKNGEDKDVSNKHAENIKDMLGKHRIFD